MRERLQARWARGALLLISSSWALGAALSAGGCGKNVACIEWTAAEGACPTRAQVPQYLAVDCSDPIVSIDSDPTVWEGLCCYDVTRQSTGHNTPCEVGPTTPGGPVGAPTPQSQDLSRKAGARDSPRGHGGPVGAATSVPRP